MHRRTHDGRPSLRVGLALLLLSISALLPSPARAGTDVSHDAGLALSPYSETGPALQIKSVSVNARVEDGLSRTALTTVFSNTLTQQCQASLDLTVPRDSVVTGYAYWFKGERIQAKLMDNDKAWEIYRTITSHHRDPAIMEQWFDTTYHLQIYPVEPGKDLRVEVSYVAPLESDAGGLYYRLPLEAGSAATKLDRLEAKVVFAGVETSRLIDSEGLAPGVEGGSATYYIVREQWQPERDWRFRIRPRGRRLQSHGQAVATTRGRGFFSVVLWAPRKLDRPQLRISGPGIRGVHKRGFLREVPSGRRLVVTGRYLRPGRLRIGFRDRRMGWSQARLTLPSASSVDAKLPIPKKLWAASEIKRQSGALGHWEGHRALAGRQRARVVRMSLDYGVLSPYTAWLAVPKSEYEFYLKTKREQESRVQTNAESVRGGDPLVRVVAAPDILRVTAFHPSGEPIPMTLHQGVWEGRFDLPADTAEGSYQVVVLIERAAGKVQRLTLSYTVDRAGPAGQAYLRAEGDVIRVTVTADADTRSAHLLFPDGARLPLQRVPEGSWTAAFAPVAPRSGSLEIVLLDGAHNVTRILLDPQGWATGPEGSVR